MPSIWFGVVLAVGAAIYLLVRRAARSDAHRAAVGWCVTLPVVLAATIAAAAYRTELGVRGPPWFWAAISLVTLTCSATLSNVATSVAYSWNEGGLRPRVSLLASAMLALAVTSALELIDWFGAGERVMARALLYPPADPSEHQCPSIYWEEGLFIALHLEEGWPAGNYRFVIEHDRETTICSGRIPLQGTNLSIGIECSHDDVIARNEHGVELAIFTHPAKVDIEVLRDGVSVTRVHYDIEYHESPIGLECGTLRIARIGLRLPAAR